MTVTVDAPLDLNTIAIEGYKRADGQVGIRNRLLVLFTVVCAEEVSRRIAWQLEDAVVAGWRDCLPDAGAQRKMIRIAQNAIAKGIERGRAMLDRNVERVTIPFSDLIVGVECGGSDTTSGIAANPAVGAAADRIIVNGGTVIFEETNELLGCESSLGKRAVNEEVRAEILRSIEIAREWGDRTGQRAISSGNIEGGLTTIEEKSLGAYAKSGQSSICGILKPGDTPIRGGLYLMDMIPDGDVRWGFPNINDNTEVAELIACGSHVVLFSTGRGSVVGSAVSPVIQVCANP
jgi:altronate dehydratase large subunit